MSEELLFVSLGGIGEIGMNLYLYGYQGKWLMVDLGVTFGEEGMPMIDVVMADPGWIEERRDDLVGLVVTHGHEDHLGAIPYLWPRLGCPIYAAPFPAAILAEKLKETGLEKKAKVTVIPPGGRFKAGPFDIETVGFTHSIPDSRGLAIRTKFGTVFHTGDWKFDPDPLIGPTTDFEALRRIGKEGVLALVGDSTNVFCDKEAGSESAVRAGLIELFGRFKGKIAVGCFATNVARVESVAVAAHMHGRHVALVGRSLWRIDRAARALGLFNDLPEFLSDRDAAHLPNDKLLFLCTGSQGEPRSAFNRISLDEHPHVTLGRGDTAIFSSRVIPGNEKAIFGLQNRLTRQGVHVVTDHDAFIHVSGHPGRPELTELYGLLRPQIAVPMHGEVRHVQEHANLARGLGVEQAVEVVNGEMVRLAPGPAEVVDVIPTGKLGLDGPRLLRLDGDTLRTRRRMVFNGSAVTTVVLDRVGRVVGDPLVSAPGLLEEGEDAAIHEAAVEYVREAVEDIPQKARCDDGVVREAARLAVRRAFKEHLGHKPVTEVHLVRV